MGIVSTNKPITVILLLFVFTAALEVFVIDIRQGPDEMAHFIYVKSIAEHFRIPIPTSKLVLDETSRASYQSHHPPFYYLIAALPYHLAKMLHADTNWLYYAVRLMTVFIGAFWIYLTWRLSLEFFGVKSFAPTVVAAFTAFLPLSTYMSAVINNDVLQALFFTWGMWHILVYMKRDDFTVKSGIRLGVISGLAILTKAQGLLLIPTICLAVILKNGRVWRKEWQGLLATFGAVLIISSWWYIRSYCLSGQLVPHTLLRPIFDSPAMMLANIDQFYLPFTIAVKNLFRYFWTPYWIMEHLGITKPYTDLLTAFSLLSVAGMLVNLVRGRNNPELRLRRQSIALLSFTFFILFASVMYQIFFIDWYVFQQGRLFLPIAGVVGIVFTIGLGEFVPRRIKCGAAVAAVATLPAINWGFLWIVRLFYQFQ